VRFNQEPGIRKEVAVAVGSWQLAVETEPRGKNQEPGIRKEVAVAVGSRKRVKSQDLRCEI